MEDFSNHDGGRSSSSSTATAGESGRSTNAAAAAAAAATSNCPTSPINITDATSIAQSHEELISLARAYYRSLGYRVHSGLQFGCELVLYADHPDLVHSDFCVCVIPPDGRLDWRRVQCLTRQMGDWKKTLIVAEVRRKGFAANKDAKEAAVSTETSSLSSAAKADPNAKVLAGIEVRELAISTEHAPFRHRGQHTVAKTGTVDIGSQKKRQKLGASLSGG